MKVILHIDLDSYFVSAARTVDPSLIGKPVAITTNKRRSIISAISYEAKKNGVHVPMPFFKAKKLIPDLIAVEPNFPLYTVLSTKLFELISKKYTKKIEVASIDECYLDATDIIKNYRSIEHLCKDIQDTVFKELKLPCSIGVGRNKFIAKMSTQINKPNGITITKYKDLDKVFGDWDVQKIHGVGGPTAEKLRENGIKTIRDLANSNIEDMEMILGKSIVDIINNIRGNGSDEINTEHNDLKGIGNSITFQDKDRSTRREILDMLSHMCEKVSGRMYNRNMAGSVISVAIKPKGGKEVKATRKQRTLSRPIHTFDEIYEEATRLLDELWNGETLKFIGVHVTKLDNIFDTTIQASIFDEVKEVSKTEMIIKEVNKELKKKVLTSLTELEKSEYIKQNQSRFIESDKLINKKN